MSEESPNAKFLSARLLAVQALYQKSQTAQAIKTLYQEYIEHRAEPELDGRKLVMPDGALFKTILYGVGERQVELESIIAANLKKDASDREIEPLLLSILVCGAYELMAQQDIDAPIIINDYLNVAHSFYGKNEVALINGVLDSIAKLFR